jgi:hypothetical protein
MFKLGVFLTVIQEIFSVHNLLIRYKTCFRQRSVVCLKLASNSTVGPHGVCPFCEIRPNSDTVTIPAVALQSAHN